MIERWCAGPRNDRLATPPTVAASALDDPRIEATVGLHRGAIFPNIRPRLRHGPPPARRLRPMRTARRLTPRAFLGHHRHAGRVPATAATIVAADKRAARDRSQRCRLGGATHPTHAREVRRTDAADVPFRRAPPPGRAPRQPRQVVGPDRSPAPAHIPIRCNVEEGWPTRSSPRSASRSAPSAATTATDTLHVRNPAPSRERHLFPRYTGGPPTSVAGSPRDTLSAIPNP